MSSADTPLIAVGAYQFSAVWRSPMCRSMPISALLARVVHMSTADIKKPSALHRASHRFDRWRRFENANWPSISPDSGQHVVLEDEAFAAHGPARRQLPRQTTSISPDRD